MAFSASEPVICSAYVDFVAAITSVQASSISFFVVRSVLRSIGERFSGAYYHRFSRVDESFRANTRAGLTRARSLNTWVYSERNAVTHLPRALPLVENLVRGKYRYAKNQEKKRKLSQERLLSEKTPRFLL